MPVFTARTHYYGITTSPYYNEYNAYQGSLAMPNCVAYSYGRFNELSRVTANPWSWPTGNGNQWFGQAPGLGLLTGSTPQVGACICWDSVPGQGSGEGHTANVETLIRDGQGNVTAFRISNSLYSATDRTPKDEMPYFFMGTVQMSNLNRIDYDNGYFSIYVFQGFIYHPLYPPSWTPSGLTKEQLVAVIAGRRKKPVTHIIRR